MNGKQIIVPLSSQKQILDDLHNNHMGIEKTWLIAREEVHWINVNGDIGCVVKQYATCLEYQWTQPQEKVLHYEIPCRPWELVGADVSMINGKTLLCIVDYHNKFPKVKKVNSLSADNLVQMTKLTFAEYGHSKKIVSNTGTNFTSKTFKDFYKKVNIQQTIISSYHHQCNE